MRAVELHLAHGSCVRSHLPVPRAIAAFACARSPLHKYAPLARAQDDDESARFFSQDASVIEGVQLGAFDAGHAAHEQVATALRHFFAQHSVTRKAREEL